MDDIYRENIMDHYRNPRNFGRLKSADYSSYLENPLCGDKLGMEIKIKNKGKIGIISEINFFGDGCAISISSASMLTEHVLGLDVLSVRSMRKEDVLKLLGITLTPTRLKCALLPLEVLHNTLALVKK
jgi:nitrogen fixation protein NifU and related proteins